MGCLLAGTVTRRCLEVVAGPSAMIVEAMEATAFLQSESHFSDQILSSVCGRYPCGLNNLASWMCERCTVHGSVPGPFLTQVSLRLLNLDAIAPGITINS